MQHNNSALCDQRRSKKVAIAQPQNGVIYPPASLDSNPVTLSSSLSLSLSISLSLSLFLCLSMLPPLTATLSFALLLTKHKVEPKKETLTGQRYPRYWLNNAMEEVKMAFVWKHEEFFWNIPDIVKTTPITQNRSLPTRSIILCYIPFQSLEFLSPSL